MNLKTNQEDVSNLQNTQREERGEEKRMENNKQQQKSRHGHQIKPASEREARDRYRGLRLSSHRVKVL